MDENLRKKIQKLALQNAIEHDGVTKDKIVLSKALGIIPELRSNVRESLSDITNIVSEINELGFEGQKDLVQNEFPEILKIKSTHKEQRVGFPKLEDAQQGNVVTRFPPEPNGYPHIGHAKAAIINDEYAKMYGGKLVLRFDDTNPAAERLEFFAAIKVGLDWLGIKYDIVKNTSDDMELIYEKGAEMIHSDYAYVCTCKKDEISKNRREMISCKCSKKDTKENKERWEKMFTKFKPGDAIVRFRGDMESKNTVMRDPVLFRIAIDRHPLLEEKYRVWPSYDFAVAIEDSIDGITHAFRSKEYELRRELYYAILDLLNMRKPEVIEFSRLAFKGMPVSKRVLKPLIEEGKVSGYDDPRLPTLEAMKRRGITPEAIRKYIMSLGFTKSDTLAPFDALEAFNRKIIDENSIRLHLVKEPRKIIIQNLPTNKITLPNHPSKDLGNRELDIEQGIFVSAEDIEMIKVGDEIRLMGLGNISITRTNNEIITSYIGDKMNEKIKKIQWVPAKNAHKLKILIPQQLMIKEEFNEGSLEEINVLTEPYFTQMKDEDEIQFIRFGYCRKDSINQAVYTHK